MFDQVLIRPDLLPYFNNQDLKVFDNDGENSLLSGAGLADDNLASDHLPIYFKLML